MPTFGLIEALFDYRADLILWTFASIGIYGLGANLVHFLRSPSAGRFGRWLRTSESRPYGSVPLEVLRFLYYLCVPYVALTRGVTNASLMGLWSIDWFKVSWFERLGLGTVLGLGTLVLLLWGWRRYLQAATAIGYWPYGRPFMESAKTVLTPWGWGLILLEVLYLEIHWAFYRGATIRLLGDYYGVFLSMLVIVGEWWLNPQTRRYLSMARQNGETLTTVAMALSVTIVYYFTSNLWLCVAVHMAVQCGLLLFMALWYGSPDYEGQED